MSSAAIHRNQVDLLDFVDWTGVECLNQNSVYSLVNALKQGYREDEGLHLQSDADEQLLIYIPFMQVVKLHSVVIVGPEEEGLLLQLSQQELETAIQEFNVILLQLYNFIECPRTVKLFANKEHMGFSNVNDYPPSDSADLSVDNLKGKPVILKYVKFQNVRSLTIFIEDNQDGTETTKVQKIILHGTTVDTTNMKDLKKIEEH